MLMTSKERFKRMFEHKEADRIPITDSPWTETIERWENEGLPKGMPFNEYLDIDHIERFETNVSPRYPKRIIEETDEYTISTTKWGVTLKKWKHASSTPEYLDFTITDRDKWNEAKALITPSRDRIDWKDLDRNYKNSREKGHWLRAGLWFGFDVTHAHMVGTERVLIAMYEDPEWLMDMFNHCLETEIAQWNMILDAGYEFDEVFWWDDMGYKNSQFFSIDMYREIVKPFHKRAIEWAHSKGMVTMLHSCGMVEPFIPDLIEIGLDGLNPLEVKAGMDPIKIKKEHGKDLLLYGGISAILWDKPAELEAAINEIVPVLKQDGGYIFSSDHSVPPNVSLENFRFGVELAKKLGKY